MTFLRKIIEAHSFFCRKSQHYVMGNWNEYEKWFHKWEFDEFGYGRYVRAPFNKQKWFYTTRFIPAYIRFMKDSIVDIYRAPIQ